MTYDLDTPTKGNVLPATTEEALSHTPSTTDVGAGAFALDEPGQRFLAGRHWLAEGDAVFTREVAHLVEHGWTANDRNEHGDALLHVAVRSARWSSVAWLLEHGADPLLTNNHGHTPVWLARRRPVRHLPPVFRELVEQARGEGLLEDPAPTAAATRPSRAGKPSRPAKTPAAPSPVKPSREPKAAREAQAVPPVREPREPKPSRAPAAPVVSAQAQRFTDALVADDRALMMQLLVEGFELGAHNEHGNTVLHEALARNAWEWSDRLINYGAPLLARDRQGKTVLDHVEQRWSAQDAALDLDRYETFKDALADEKAAQRVALGQGVTRSTKSIFRDVRPEATIDWQGLPEDPDRAPRPSTPKANPSRPGRSGGKSGKPNRGSSFGVGHPTRARKNGGGAGKTGRKGGNGGQPNPLVTNLGQGRKSSLDRPLREASDYHVPRGATLAPDVVIVRKVRRTLVKP